MENYLAQKILLEITARGQALISRLCSLEVPADFSTYSKLFPDNSSFEKTDFQQLVHSESDINDEQLRSTHLPFLHRFYAVLEGILVYSDKLNRYFHELESGFFIQENLTSLLSSADGKQLAAESIYYAGLMLLLIDIYVDGNVRERLILAYRRWMGIRASLPHFDRICQLFFQIPQPPNSSLMDYKFKFFEMLKISPSIISRVISKISTDDIYNQLHHYPLPEHKTTALSAQASMIVVILCFSKDTMENDTLMMRELVDRHFADNFVVSFFMGRLFDLTILWDNLPAARSALLNIQDTGFFKKQVSNNLERAEKIYLKLKEILPLVNDEFILENISASIEYVTEANSVIKWLLLHQKTENKKLAQVYRSIVKSNSLNLMDLLFTSAYFEYILKTTIKRLLDEKLKRWNTYKSNSIDHMKELSEYFGGTKALTRVEKNQDLEQWFFKVSDQISKLDQNLPLSSGRSLVRIIQALEEIQDLHQMDTNIHLRSFVNNAISHLKNMLRLLNAKEDLLVTLQQVTDFSYAWNLMPSHIKYMQESIRKDPSYVGKLRATFLKMASAMDIYILRINQNHSDLVQASQFYSSSLVSFAESVFQIIPETIFVFLDEIIKIQVSILKPIPPRLLKSSAPSLVQHTPMKELNLLISNVSKFTDGYLALETTLVGVIKIDPHALLDAGIRRELRDRLCRMCEEIARFSKKSNFIDIIEKLGMFLKGTKDTILFLQDFLRIQAITLWNEVWTEVVCSHVLDTCLSFRTPPPPNLPHPHSKSYRELGIRKSISHHSQLSLNFMGRIVEEMIVFTLPERSTYYRPTEAWYDTTTKTKDEKFSRLDKQRMYDALGDVGLRGLDLIFESISAFRLSSILSSFNAHLFPEPQQEEENNDITNEDERNELRDFVFMIRSKTRPVESIPKSFSEIYNLIYSTFEKKLQKSLRCNLVHDICKLGQIQILRTSIHYELYEKYRLWRGMVPYLSSLRQFSQRLYKSNVENTAENNVENNEDSSIYFGMVPIWKYQLDTKHQNYNYENDENVESLSVLIFCLLLTTSTKVKYNHDMHVFEQMNQTRDKIDTYPLIYGLLSIIYSTNTKVYSYVIRLVDQYVRSLLNVGKEPKDEVMKLVGLFNDVCVETRRVNSSVFEE